MKNFYKFFLALWVSISAFAQITEITRLPVQDISQSLKESAPVWLSDNELMIFYVNQTKDTIFSTQSTNRGLSWSQPKFLFKVELLQQTQELIYPAAFKSKSGRLILAWSVLDKGINLTYSDDNGVTWSSLQLITGISIQNPFIKNFHFIKITQMADESLTLCFNPSGDQGTLYYKQSMDDGQTWSETAKRIVTTGGYRYDEHTVISADPNTLICVFKYRATLSSPYHIGARYSYDNGVSWGDILNLSGNSTNEIFPGITKDNSGNLWLVFVRIQKYTFEQSLTYEVGDIYYRKSSDNGLTWSEEKQFTKYVGDDGYTSVNSSGKAPFVCYSTQKFTGKNQISFGVLDETLEKYTPPHLFHLYSPSNVSSAGFIIRAFAKDDNQIKFVSVNVKESDATVELFDDGLHEDLEANDGVYGNVFPHSLLPANGNYFFTVNKVQLPLSNMGSIAGTISTHNMNTLTTLSDSDNNSNTFEKKVQVYLPSLGTFEEGSFLFAGGFFLSGYSNGSLWSNAVALASLVQDYLPGTVGSNPSDPKFNFYVVRKDDIPFGSSWQRWKDAVELGAEFYDGDGDGVYNPIDRNWNGTWDKNEDMPMLIGDLTAWCLYNDGKPTNQRRWQSAPQGIEIRQTVFASSKPELENVVFIRYSILNTGTIAEVMDSVYFGLWEDADVGDAYDDVVGCDTLLQSGYYYAKSADWVYGENPPSFFSSLLQGPLVNTNLLSDSGKINYGQQIGSKILSGTKNLRMSSHVFFVGGSPDLRDANSVTEASNYLKGQNRLGVFPNPCTFAYGEVRGGVNCNQVDRHFWFSGDPVTDIGWISTQQRDHRNMVNTGPFKLEKDKPQDIIVAYVIGRGTDPINSITIARENVQRVIQEYQSNFASMTYSPPPPTNPIKSYLLYQNYPNPFNPTTTIRYELPQDGVVTIEVFDILGQKVKTILNEFRKADRYEVTFNSAGLASGVYIYQLRVNDFVTSKKMMILR